MESKKKKISQEFLTLSVLTLITVLVWAGFEIYWAYNKSTIEVDVRQQLAPLDPKLDRETLKKLQERREISFEELFLNEKEEPEEAQEITPQEEGQITAEE